MPEVLAFRLYGPMAAWGDIAVGEERPTFSHPTKSAVLGLVAAALGVTRDEDARHRALAEEYAMAVLVDAPGALLRDFHTVQTPPQTVLRGQNWVQTRQDELACGREVLSTIVSWRDYLCDALATVFLWPSGRGSAPSPHEIREALEQPAFVLYLGRKSCPLAIPVQAQVVEAETIREAYEKAVFMDLLPFRELPAAPARLYWERGLATGFPEEGVLTFRQRDGVVSRERWQFSDRQEQYMTVPREGLSCG